MTPRRLAQFSLLLALTLVLSWLDRSIPVTWFLSGAIPGIKLGLANTVLLYAIYLMDWKSAIVLMVAKVVLTGFMFGSLSAILYSLSGGILSLAVMLLVKRYPAIGALVIAAAAFASDVLIIRRAGGVPTGDMLWCAVLIALAAVSAIVIYILLRRHKDHEVLGVSLAGGVFHNVGQMLAAAALLRVPQLLYIYLPVLVGMGAVVGCLTGIVARLAFRALRANGAGPRKESDT